jgi:hypothetical protein
MPLSPQLNFFRRALKIVEKVGGFSNIPKGSEKPLTLDEAASLKKYSL